MNASKIIILNLVHISYPTIKSFKDSIVVPSKIKGLKAAVNKITILETLKEVPHPSFIKAHTPFLFMTTKDGIKIIETNPLSYLYDFPFPLTHTIDFSII